MKLSQYLLALTFLFAMCMTAYAEIKRDMSCVHKDLASKTQSILKSVNKHCPSGWEIAVFETCRTTERQKKLVQDGYSKTMKSKHLKRPSEAVDLVWKHNGKWSWESPRLTNGKDGWGYLEELKKAEGLRIISWDKPHLELK